MMKNYDEDLPLQLVVDSLFSMRDEYTQESGKNDNTKEILKNKEDQEISLRKTCYDSAITVQFTGL